MKGFCIDWVAGPSAQVELYSTVTESGVRRFHFKYTSPFRKIIRQPSYQLRAVNIKRLNRINNKLTQLMTTSPDAKTGLKEVKSLGDQLHTFLIRRWVQTDLRDAGRFVEMGIDEMFLHLPWELMHDGEDFLCLKHNIGRFVITAKNQPGPLQPPKTQLGSSSDQLSVLLISVPTPKPRERPGQDPLIYDRLPEAEAETQAITDTLTGRDGVELKVIPKKKATYDAVYDALKEQQWQIIHYNGHAYFDDGDPYRSSLVLDDEDMETLEIEATLRQKPPILCLINACETAKTPGTLNVYGLARAFLDTGAYLIGSRWKIQDDTAKEFAKAFYTQIVNGNAIGNAIVDARRSCRKAVPTDLFGWASYIYYGDPRVYFRRI